MALPETPNTLLESIKHKNFVQYQGHEEKIHRETAQELYSLLRKPSFARASEQHRIEIISEIQVCLQRSFYLILDLLEDRLLPKFNSWIQLRKSISRAKVQLPSTVSKRVQEQKRLIVDSVAYVMGRNDMDLPPYLDLTRQLSECTAKLATEGNLLNGIDNFGAELDIVVSRLNSARPEHTLPSQNAVDESDVRLLNALQHQNPNEQYCLLCLHDFYHNAMRVIIAFDTVLLQFGNQKPKLKRLEKEIGACGPGAMGCLLQF